VPAAADSLLFLLFFVVVVVIIIHDDCRCIRLIVFVFFCFPALFFG
jgi:hypothetical protein